MKKQEYYDEEIDRSFEWVKWRWEFIRRNPQYRKDRQQYHDIIEEIECSSEYERTYKGDYIYYMPYKNSNESELTELTEIINRWDMKAFLDPDKSLDEMIETDSTFVEGEWTQKDKKRALIFYLNPSAVEIVEESETPKFTKGKHLVIDIDFTKVNSFSSMREEVIHYVEMYYNDIYFPKKKRYMTDYQLILMVGDMKEKQKLKNRQIAEKIEPRRFRENPESAIRNVSYLFKRYKELVNGGYKSITFS